MPRYARRNITTRRRRVARRGGRGYTTRTRMALSNKPFTSETYPAIGRGNFMTYNMKSFRTHQDAILQWADLERVLSTTSGGIGAAEQIYLLNSVYDPYYGISSTADPEYLSQFRDIYWRYIVTKCDVQITWQHPSLNTLRGVMLVQPSSGTGTTLYGMDVLNSRRCFSLVSFPDGANATVPTSFTVDLANVEGLTPSQYKGDLYDYSASVNANPRISPFLRICVMDPDGASGATVKYTIKLRFHVRFYQRMDNP